MGDGSSASASRRRLHRDAVLVAAGGNPLAAATVAGTALVVALLATFRTFAYRVRPRRTAERQLEIDAAAAAILASVALPLAPTWLAVRGIAYYRAARRATWTIG